MANETLTGMDEAATKAKAELDTHFDKWTADDMVKWWSKWFQTAGHKRLGRILVEKGKA